MKKVAFDKRAVYQAKVRPVMDKLKETCERESLPFFAAVNTAVTDTGEASYENEALTPAALSMEIPNSKILQHILINRGFKAVDPKDIPAQSFDSILQFDADKEIE